VKHQKPQMRVEAIRQEVQGRTPTRARKTRVRVLVLLVLGALFGAALPAYAFDDDRTAASDQWTVLTLASDGAWGTASNFYIGRAIAFAIADCRAMSKRTIGCGAKFVTTRAGWSVAMLCGTETIIAAGKQLADAERAVADREIELRQVYHEDMPPCVRAVTVDPNGAVVTPGPRVKDVARAAR
jgi:hypothetical protein